MKRVLFLALAAVMVAISANAVPAKRQFTVTQPDGSTITVRGYGDEWSGYFTTTDGYTISPKADGYYYYVTQMPDGRTIDSNVRANDPNRRSVAERKVVGGLRTHLRSQISAEAQMLRKQVAQLTEQIAEQRRSQIQNAPGEVHQDKVLVILANYVDVKWNNANVSTINNVLNQQNYNSTGSAKDYFEDNAQGQYKITFDVVGPVELPQNRIYYGEQVISNGVVQAHDRRPQQMVIDACDAADAQVNFAEYAENGRVSPSVVVIYAGKGQANGGTTETIWPHRSSINISRDGVNIRDYFVSPELEGNNSITGIGVICHEFGHILGLPDWYDTDYEENGQGYGMGAFSLMDTGSYSFNSTTPPALNVVERWLLGWISEIPEITESGNYTLVPVYETHTGYKISTKNANEFFFMENRNGTYKWDRLFRENDPNSGYTSGFSPGRGMLIYHYDRSNNSVSSYTASQLWYYNAINAFASHQCFHMEMAQKITGNSGIGKVLYPGAGNVVSAILNSWADVFAGSLNNIAFNGDNITFTATVPDASNDPTIRNIVIKPNQFDMTVTWEGAKTGTWKVQWRAKGATMYAEHTVANKVTNIPKLLNNVNYEIVITDVSAGSTENSSATTGIVNKQKMPSLNGMKGSYAITEPVILSVVNMQNNPKSIEWSIDGTATTATCHFLTAGKHTIEAKITNVDGSIEYFKRVINVTNE